jgi:hypothetical protein
MKRRWLSCTAILSAALLLLISCAQPQGNRLLSFGQTFSGGTAEEKSNVNIKDITISQSGGDTVVTLYFVYGSRAYSNEDEARMTHVPQYQLRCFDAPYRMALEIKNIGHWDYEEKKLAATGAVSGVFRQIPVEDKPFILYFQLSQKVSFNVEENADRLTLELKAGEADEQERYFVYTNAFDEYKDGNLPQDILKAFNPTLCDDSSSVVIISKAFASQAAADSFKTESEKSLNSAYPGMKMYTAKLRGGERPAYNNAGEETVQKTVDVNGKGPVSLQVVMGDGRYLCTSADGKTMLFARPYQTDASRPSAAAGSEQNILQSLWALDASGKKTLLVQSELDPVSDAKFSPDGSMLAFTTQQDDAMILNLYDMTSGQYSELNGEGLGSTTAAFTWDSSGKAIYCMSGEEYAVQPMIYDLTKPEGSRASTLSEQITSSGQIAYFNSELYFNDDSETADQIYRVKPETGTRDVFAQGLDFEISPDGKWMAITELNTAEGAQDTYNIKIKDMAAGEETLIVPNANINDFCWSADGSTLYYLREAPGMQESKNSMLLCGYTPKSAENRDIARMSAESIFSPKNPDQLILTAPYTNQDTPLYATYLFNIPQ